MLKNDFESQNFAIFEEVVHNFGEKMLISYRCIHGLMPNLIKKSVTVSKEAAKSIILYFVPVNIY